MLTVAIAGITMAVTEFIQIVTMAITGAPITAADTMVAGITAAAIIRVVVFMAVTMGTAIITHIIYQT
ncbi:hypothetical protein DJ568_10385 [Mucilaginibacter hurinus]|uniref:Uncharacterized protein n=1 Tax=Mucilaginibacter hurinus TaxID=2201324 RepID=A0A367GN32_9SPHI|nr:hypothetical protein DJ568_10385 [Mucilaginibacter hurinus]